MTELPVTWLVARASGILALALLTLSVVAGLVLKTRPFGKRIKGATALEIHRSLSIAGLVAIAVHGVALVLDTSVEIGWSALIIPGQSSYRPLWTSLGVVAAELMLILVVSFRLRRFIGVSGWRHLHRASYLTFAFAMAHGIFAGSDTQHPWMQITYITMIATVAGAVAFRVVSPAPPKPSTPRGRTTTSAHTRSASRVSPRTFTSGEQPQAPAMVGAAGGGHEQPTVELPPSR